MLKNMSWVWVLAVGAVSGMAACGDDEGGATTSATATSSSTSGTGGATTTTTATSTSSVGGAGGAGGSGGAGGASACTDTPFPPVAEDAGTVSGYFIYLGQSTLAAPVDVIALEWQGATPPAVGTYTINDDNYSTCQTCVLMTLGCDENLGMCQTRLLATSGTIEVTSNAGTLEGTLTNAGFIEVDINDQAVSTPVPNGQTQCWPAYNFSATIQ